MHPEQQYLDLLQDILENGIDKPNRTGVDTRALFGRTMRFSLEDGFPAITTKKLFFTMVAGELLGFLRGYDNAADFRDLGVTVWDGDANENPQWVSNPNRKGKDDLGRIYGAQWRSWTSPNGKATDQLQHVIDGIKNSPNSRRLVVTAWNPGELNQMALPPCHMFFQFFTRGDKLDMSMYQRSCDTFLGVPFNIASYALLLSMVAHVTGYKPGEFVHVLGDTHLYHNHFEQVKEQLAREPLALPQLWLNPEVTNIDDFTPEDIKLVRYEHHPPIKAKLNVGQDAKEDE